MADQPGTVDKALAEIGQALTPLRDALSSVDRFSAFMVGLGWRVDDIPTPLRDLGAGLTALYEDLGALIDTDPAIPGPINAEVDLVGRIAHEVRQVIDGIQAIASSPGSIPADLVADGFLDVFPRQLVGHLLASYLHRYHPQVAFALRALGVIKTRYVEPAGNRPPYVQIDVDVADLPKVLSDPSLVLRNAFGWGTADFDFAELAGELASLASAIRIRTYKVDLDQQAVLGATETEPDPDDDVDVRALKVVPFERFLPSGRVAGEISLLELPATPTAQPGLALLPSFNAPLSMTLQVGDTSQLTVRSDLDIVGGIGVQLRPDHPLRIIVGFNSGDGTSATGSIDVQLQRTDATGDPTVILGAADSTRLQLRRLGGAGGVRLAAGADPDAFAEFQLVGLEFVLSAEGADGFIAAILPKGGVGFNTDLTIGLSTRDGIYFRGTTNLEITVPAHVQLGPVEVQGLTISATPSADGIPIGLGATLKVALGPLTASVEGIGLTATLAVRSTMDGNLGPVDLSLGFKPPKGIGLAVDAGMVSGGGYLYLDPDKGEYAGAIELTFAGTVAVKAIGIITTKMPDGSPGFSLLIIMSAEFATGIQLGFGFTLLAVGGILGLNRGMNLQALTDGVRSGAITSVMFPKDVVANAPKIISDLRTFFPPRDGVFLIGPMAKLGWGSPTLVSISLGLVIEIPGNIALLGVLTVAIPADDVAVIQLKVLFIGAVEFDKQRLYFFATLFDSRVVFLTIDGEMGLLVNWGDDANFVASVGGFNPRFSPPPLPFPQPKRIQLSLLSSSAARVNVDGYFAVTSNTVQFGAKLDLFFGLDEFNVSGDLAFDALFQFSPFALIADLSGSLSVTVFGIGLFSVGINGTLEGPTPWHFKGHGSISLLFWDLDVDVEKTWGDSRDTTLPPVPVLPLLQNELAKPDSWRAVLPDSSRTLVTVRAMPAEEAALILHPAGVLRISQRLVPLQLTLDRVGNQRPSDVNRLTVSTQDGGLVRRDDAYERFAPGQFRDFSDADKVSQPAFELEPSGLDLAADGADLRTSGMVKRIVRYEEIIIDNNFKRFAQRLRPYVGTLFRFFLGGNAATRSTLSAATRRRLVPFPDTVQVVDDTYTVAFADTNLAASATFRSAASAQDYLAAQVAADPNLAEALHVIPTCEVAA